MKHRKLNLILRFFEGAKGYFLIAIAASLITTILNSLTPQIFRFTVDSVLEGKKYAGCTVFTCAETACKMA